MITLYELNELAQIAKVPQYELLLSAYNDENIDLSHVCDLLAQTILINAK